MNKAQKDAEAKEQAADEKIQELQNQLADREKELQNIDKTKKSMKADANKVRKSLTHDISSKDEALAALQNRYEMLTHQMKEQDGRNLKRQEVAVKNVTDELNTTRDKYDSETKKTNEATIRINRLERENKQTRLKNNIIMDSRKNHQNRIRNNDFR